MNITDVRKNLSDVVRNVARTANQVIIVRDSNPEAVLIPYSLAQKNDAKWKKGWEKMLEEGKKVGQKWARKNRVDVASMSEEEIYDLVKKA